MWLACCGKLVKRKFSADASEIFDCSLETHGSVLDRSLHLVSSKRQALLKDDISSNLTSGLSRPMVSWTPPEQGVYKLNSDGVKNLDNGLAKCGGFVRDVVGNWLIGFTNVLSVRR
ncbi:hypothetical protein V6N11_023615 [Hibiscus sabdariffa]|uniref:RNase H type-1 domain-containing protein n=1 Tax=Hibiscus sabdariffa TaxID=183260 RepID=A0ABR2TMP8_9ROSI